MSHRAYTRRQVAAELVELPYTTWNIGDSIAFEARVRSLDVSANERWAAFARGDGRAWARRTRPHCRLDCTAPGQVFGKEALRDVFGRSWRARNRSLCACLGSGWLEARARSFPALMQHREGK